MNEPQKNGNGESRIRRVLFNEFSLIAAVIGAAYTIYALFASPTQANELEIAVLKEKVVGLEVLPEKIDELRKDITNLRILIEQRLPNK